MSQITTFSKIFKLLNLKSVKEIIKKNESDKYTKKFGTLEHLAALLFVQLSKSKSLRDLEIQMGTKQHNIYSIKTKEIKRSTLSDANKKRNSDVFRDIALSLVRSQKKDIQNITRLIDSSIIRVDGRGSSWTKPSETRHGKGLKLHIEFGNENSTIHSFWVSHTNVNDITKAQKIELEKDKIYIFDKGYFDFNWWHKIDSCKSYFVTRIKKNTVYKIIQKNSTKHCSKQVITDQIIHLINKNPRGGKKNLFANKPLRLIEYHDTIQNKIYFFISNLLSESAEKIALLYKQRWDVELLFKWLKQNLKITQFISENENAIKTQIYVAIIAYVLIKMFKEKLNIIHLRTIDLMSWIKISLISVYIPPPIHRFYKR